MGTLCPQLPIEEDPHLIEAGEEEDQAGRRASSNIYYLSTVCTMNSCFFCAILNLFLCTRCQPWDQLFVDEDRELHTTQTTSSALSITEQVQKEIFKGLPAIPSEQHPVAWWG